MKVYLTKENKNTMIPVIFMMIFFGTFFIGVFIAVITSDKSFIDILASFGIELVFATIFFGFDIYFFAMLLKKPKGYKAKLVNKRIDNYNGKQITYMEFSTEKESKQEEDFIATNYECYTIGENNLIVGNNYLLKIKEFNWEPKYVEEFNISYKDKKNKIATKVPSMTLFSIFWALRLIFGLLLFLCILGMIIYPQYTFIYVIFSIFCGGALFITFKGYKNWKQDNNLETIKKDLNLELEKNVLVENKVGNVIIKYFLPLLLIWFIIPFKLNIFKEMLIIIVSIGLFLELLIILYSNKYDEKLIKKHKINISENINISNVKYFNIFRATKNTFYSQYFIVDQSRNLIFKIKKNNFLGNKFNIFNSNNIKIGEIKHKIFSLTNEFIVSIINEKTFIIHPKMQLHSNYQIIGRDYYVKGDLHLVRNVICDNKDNAIAYISAVSKRNNNWCEVGNTEVVLNNNVNNNIDIIIIALCVTMGNLQTFHKRINR